MNWSGILFDSPQRIETAVGGRMEKGSWVYNPYLLLGFRLLLAAVFVYAAVQKIGKPLAFADEIRMYHILDIGPPLYIMAIALPWIELLCGVSLVTGIFLRGSALILLALNTVFLVAVSFRTAGVMEMEGIPFMQVFFDCGCGFGETFAWKKLLEDSIFFLLSLALLVAPGYRFILSPARR
ncbi:MAG: DoxX family membrane protein [bacterium]|nr:MAG: DoxX family membrane protein [bacterium]